MDEKSVSGRANKSGKEGVSRRSVLSQLAAGGAVVAGSTGITAASGPSKGKSKKEKKYADPKEAKKVFRGVGQKLLAQFASDQLPNETETPTVGELVDESGVTTFTATIEGQDVVHVQVDYKEQGFTLVHHVELSRTVAMHHQEDATVSYVNDSSGDGIETLACNTTTKCSSCDCPGEYDLQQQYYRTCCCCGPNSYCSYSEKNTSGDDCCTKSDNCCNFC